VTTIREPEASDAFAASIGLHHAIDRQDLDEDHPPQHRANPVAEAALDAGGEHAPARRATAGDPVPDAGLIGADAHDGDSIDAIRARLAARGLVVQGPAVIVPDAPPVAERPVVLDDVLAEAEGDSHPNAVAEDDWDVATEDGALVSVGCPQCRGTQLTPIDVTRFRCRSCERAWRWAVCESCDEVGFAVERQESWRCKCGHFTRSWWRTDVARRDALVVVARRRDLAARTERDVVRAGMRRRRGKIIAGAMVGLVLVLGFVLSVRAGDRTPAAGTAETCRQFERLRADLGSGTLSAAELSDSLAKLADAAGVADTAVHDAAIELAAVGSPSKTAFLIAQTNLADACTAFEAKR